MPNLWRRRVPDPIRGLRLPVTLIKGFIKYPQRGDQA